jgi:Transposase/Transposase IS116/IS110/IS902 family
MTVPSEPVILVGIDWATRAHEVCVLDGQRQILGRKSFLNTPTGLEALVGWLIERAGGDPTRVAVAIERPDGLVVEALLDHKIAVFTLNPKQLDRFRDRFSAAGAKDDRRDALVLADALRTDRQAFRRVTADPDHVVALRGAVREDDALRIEETALSNRFRDYLGRYYPQLLGLAADRSDPLLWDLWELAPTPREAAAVSRRAVAALLRRRRIRRLDVAAVMEALTGPAPRVADATVAASAQVIRRLLPRLRLAHAQRRDCSREIQALLKTLEAPPGETQDQHSDAAILRSLPGVGRVVLARMLTEAAEAIRHRDLSRLRALGGSAPVTQRSGKTCHVLMRRACSAGLRFAYYHWARTAAQNDDRSAAHYRELRRRGQSHGRALRGVVDRLLSVAVAMLRAGTLYDASLRPVREPAEGRRERSGAVAEVGAGA